MNRVQDLGRRSVSDPLVSICVPTYNAERTIRRTMQSILAQTYRNLEIIVVDNASTDNSVQLVEATRDPRVRIYRNSENIGGERNFTRSVELATGEYTAVFHSDDVYTPQMVEKQVNAFTQHPAVGAVFTMARYINPAGEVIKVPQLPRRLRKHAVLTFPEVFAAVLDYGNFLVFPSAMMKTAVYRGLLPFNVAEFGTSADLDMWFRVAECCPIIVLEEHLMEYRVSTQQGSYTSRYLRTEEADFFKVVDYYLSREELQPLVTKQALARYELARGVDGTRRAVNHLIKGEVERARNLLRDSARSGWRGVSRSLDRPRLIAYWSCGCALRVLLFARVGRCLGGVLHWLLYKWLRRRYA